MNIIIKILNCFFNFIYSSHKILNSVGRFLLQPFEAKIDEKCQEI